MLRDLNENEMMMVSGGGTVSDCVGSADGTTVTCTYHEGNTEIITYGGIGGGSLPLNNTFGDPHVGLGVFGQIGLGGGGGEDSTPPSTSYEDSTAEDDSNCNPPPLGFDSWLAYNNSLGGDRGEQRLLNAVYGLQDYINIRNGCN